MPIAPLSPKQAAGIARGVYQLRTKALGEAVADGDDLGVDGLFAADAGRSFEGRSGALMFKAASGFGYLAAGTGRRQGELLIATRGTAVKIDWLSNFNIGLQNGPSAHVVHAGFNEVWKSFQPVLREFVRGRNFSHVHCVGHSLGGALAALNADWITASGVAGASLYTFGAPRVGLPPFAQALEERLPGSIYRVSHVADPVPMIPLFPFRHAPYAGSSYLIRNGGGLVSVAAHNVKSSYIPGVGDAGWAALEKDDEGPGADARIKRWIETAAGGSGPAHLSATVLGMIARALHWLLRKSGTLLAAAFGTVLAAGATVLDQVAWLLSRAAELSADLAGHLKSLIGAVFRFLGRTVGVVVELTTAFLRWVLDLLWSAMQGLATRALTVAGSLF